jgi:hypothetical protein
MARSVTPAITTDLYDMSLLNTVHGLSIDGALRRKLVFTNQNFNAVLFL